LNQKASRLRPPAPSHRPLEEWVAYRFGLVAARMGTIGQQAYQTRHKISTSSWRALAVIARFEPCSATELSSHSRLDAPKVSRAIEALVARKLIKREKAPEDLRRAVLALTPLGRRVYEDVAAFAEKTEAFVTATLTAEERRVMWRAVAKIDAQLALLGRYPPENS
jgi:DNA-binding MarR family transcriptional regulator